jgi:hypothetical protein
LGRDGTFFITQAARAAIVSEMTGRAMIYMGTVSSALIAFGFLAPTADLAPFVAGVLPALLLFGELSSLLCFATRWRTLCCSVRSTLNVAQHGTLLLPEPAIRR